ncbi:MAG: thioesterase family protein [Acidimicrobiia bacterium]|nr:thioesterase family protein [Acidimicrobiia bacterium]
MSFEFDRDTAVTRLGDGEWSAAISPDWNIGTIPNGGYLMAICLGAIGRELSHPDPLTVTGHFLGRVTSGEPAIVEVEVLREGRTLSTACARLLQGDKERLRMLATFGDLEAAEGPTHVTADPPEMPPPEECVQASPGREVLEIFKRFDFALAPEVAGGAMGMPVGRPEIGGWIRFADGREPDLASLALFADALPPTVLNLDRFGWVPTIELTIHFRAKPAPGWLRAWFVSRFLMESHVEEDGEIWDSEGNLVALSRQLARILPRS